MKPIYFDYAASTPVDPRVFEAMQPYFSLQFGNPGSLHSFGQEAMAAIDKSRETIAKSIGADFREIVFTGSATEANNFAIRGIVKKFQSLDSGLKPPRIIISSIEHESILETARDLESEGVDVVHLPVDRHGVVDLEKLKSSLDEHTVLVSVMYANNEIGVVQPIKEIAKIIRDYRAIELSSYRARPLFHTDAVQAFQFFDCDASELGVDLMTLSAHKIYGPKGIGALYVRNPKHEAQNSKQAQNIKEGKSENVSDFGFRDSDFPVMGALITGGGQEFGFRSGTENVPAIVGFAEAVKLAVSVRKTESERIAKLRDHFWSELKKIYPKAEKNGVAPEPQSSRASELPNILNVYFPDHTSEDLLARLDLAGLAVSAGSACKSRSVESSYIIEAIGHTKDRAKRSIRFSLGRPTIEGDVKGALSILGNIFS